MSAIIIRKSKREDMKRVMDMIVELATYEGYKDGPQITAEVLERDGFDKNPPRFVCHVAECTKTNRLVGYIFGNYAYSSWTGNALYIEDFYVMPELRGEKIGHKLFLEWCKLARDSGCSRIDWHVLNDNEIAKKFYTSHGAFDICAAENRTCMRIYKEEILKVTESG